MRSVLLFPCPAERNSLTGITGRLSGPPRRLTSELLAKRALRGSNLLLALVGWLAVNAAAFAGTSNSTFIVSATVQAVCQMSATAINFGTYIPGNGTTLKANSTISIQCTSGTTAPTLALNAGASGGTMANRLMVGPAAAKLQYNLYTTSSYGTVFGDGTGGSSTVPVTVGAASFTTPVQVTVYGEFLDSAANRLAAGAGTYTDTVTATLTY
jgi:spore coat protein U-like protein